MARFGWTHLLYEQRHYMNHAKSADTPVGTERFVLEMAGTSALGLLALFLTDILTLLYVAMLDNASLTAAVGVAKTLGFFLSIFSAGLAIAAGSLVSRYAARRVQTPRFVALLATRSLVIAAAVAMLLAIGGYLLREVAIGWLGPASGATDEIRGFIVLSLVATVPSALMQMSAQLLRGIGASWSALGVVLCAAVTLAIVDPLLIFVADLGLLGAGIASVIAALAAASLGGLVVGRRLGLSSPRQRRGWRVLGARLSRLSLPYTLGHLATPVSIAYTLDHLADFGVSVMAAMALMDRVLQLTFCFYFALPMALVPVFSRYIGVARGDRARMALKHAIKLVLLYGLVAWGVLALLAPWLSELFSLNAAGQAFFVSLCRGGLGLWLVIGLDFIAVSVFLSLEAPWWVALFAWVRATLGTLPMVSLGDSWFGASGVVLGFWGGNALVALASIAVATWLAQRRRIFASVFEKPSHGGGSIGKSSVGR